MYAISLGKTDDDKGIWLEYDNKNDEFDEHEFITIGQKYPENILFKVYSGYKFTDTTSSTGLSNIIRSRVFDILIDKGLTGLERHPIEIYNKKDGSYNKEYDLVRSTEVCSPIDRSVARTLPHPDNNAVQIRLGFGIDMNTVKTDFVRPDKTTMLLCNEKVKDILEAITPPVTGIKFLHISDYPV